MKRASNGSYVSSDGGTVTRGCKHCDWSIVEDGHAAMVKRYQDHLRKNHHRAWLRG